MPVAPRPLTPAERRRPLPADVDEVLATAADADAAFARVLELVDGLDDEERSRILVVAMERLGLPRE